MASRVLSPVLLLGAGTGEATCGILYLASYLRRNGLEAYVRLHDADETDAEVAASLAALVARVRPRVVGISLKWFHHVHRALLIARTLRQLDPALRIVVGGNTAAWYWQDVAAWDCVDHVILGDGEQPLLALCRGDATVPNCTTRGPDGKVHRAPFGYVQAEGSGDSYYSHFDELFLSQLDRHSFSGWVAPGKGCSENCVYCGGGRGQQQASFGRAKSFLRSVESVRADHLAIVPEAWQLRYDFSGGSAEFLTQAWQGLDLSRHATTYFLWGVPPPTLIDALARTFGRVFMVLDIGCFSELQRVELMRRGLLKPCPTDRQLFATVEACRRHPNLELEVCGIAGLPFTSARALAQELKLVERLHAAGCKVGSQRLEAQPGALVTQHAERFGMVSEARTFGEFLTWFQQLDPADAGLVPMVTFTDPKVEQQVQHAADEVQARVEAHADSTSEVLDADTRLVMKLASTRQVTLGEWLGTHRVPARSMKVPVTVMRSDLGAGLACAPTFRSRTFSDPMLQHGDTGAAILEVLEVFRKPITVQAAIGTVARKARLDPDVAGEVIGELFAGRFLQRA